MASRNRPLVVTFALALLLAVSPWLRPPNDSELPEEVSFDQQEQAATVDTKAVSQVDPARVQPLEAVELSASLRDLQIVPRAATSAYAAIATTEPKKAAKKPRPKRKSAKPTRKANPASEGSPSAVRRVGKGPVLSLEFADIGMDEFVSVIRRMGGKFFVLQDSGLGPQVLLDRGVLGGVGAAANLAHERAHIVNDKHVRARLAKIELPPGAADDRAILLFSRWADSLIWGEIIEALSDKGIAIKEVSLIEGRYLQRGHSTYVQIERAHTRNEGHVELSTSIRLPI